MPTKRGKTDGKYTRKGNKYTKKAIYVRESFYITKWNMMENPNVYKDYLFLVGGNNILEISGKTLCVCFRDFVVVQTAAEQHPCIGVISFFCVYIRSVYDLQINLISLSVYKGDSQKKKKKNS